MLHTIPLFLFSLLLRTLGEITFPTTNCYAFGLRPASATPAGERYPPYPLTKGREWWFFYFMGRKRVSVVLWKKLKMSPQSKQTLKNPTCFFAHFSQAPPYLPRKTPRILGQQLGQQTASNRLLPRGYPLHSSRNYAILPGRETQ